MATDIAVSAPTCGASLGLIAANPMVASIVGMPIGGMAMQIGAGNEPRLHNSNWQAPNDNLRLPPERPFGACCRLRSGSFAAPFLLWAADYAGFMQTANFRRGKVEDIAEDFVGMLTQ